MKFLLIGNGFIAPKHIEAIKEVGGELVALCDIDQAKEIEDLPFYIDYVRAIALSGCDAVSIAAPNYLHTDIVLEAAKYGKRILCEKPMTFRTHEIELMKGIPNLFGMFQLRHLPEIAEMRKAIVEGENQISLVVEMKRSHTYHKTWKGDPEKTGGLLVNIGSHYFDLIGHLFGYTGFSSISPIPNELDMHGILTYPNAEVHWRISLTDEKPEYERSITINDQRFDLVQKENLHIKVYKDFMWNHGITAKEEEKILRMIKSL